MWSTSTSSDEKFNRHDKCKWRRSGIDVDFEDHAKLCATALHCIRTTKTFTVHQTIQFPYSKVTFTVVVSYVDSYHILPCRYREHGITQGWYSNFSRQQQKYLRIFDDYAKHRSVHQINLVNVSGAFFLLFIGLLLSFASFFVEFIKQRLHF